MVVLQVTLVGNLIGAEQLLRYEIVGVVVLVEKPHGVRAAGVVDDLEGVGPHFFAEFSAVGVDVLELGA